MRHPEARLLDHGIPIQDQIEIERAVRARVRTLAPESLLDLQEPLEKLPRRERRLPDRRRVQKSRLFADADGIRFVEFRRPEVCDRAGKSHQSIAQVALTVAKVASQGDRYSIHLVGSTAPCRATPPVRRPRTSSNPEAACSNRR